MRFTAPMAVADALAQDEKGDVGMDSAARGSMWIDQAGCRHLSAVWRRKAARSSSGFRARCAIRSVICPNRPGDANILAGRCEGRAAPPTHEK